MFTELLLWVQAAAPAPNYQALAIQIPEILIVPILAYGIMVMIRTEAINTFSGTEIGMELSILAAGACASIFANDTLQAKFGIEVTVYGFVVAFLCVFVAALLSRWRRKLIKDYEADTYAQPPSKGAAIVHLMIGAVPMTLVTGLLILGYTWTPPGR
jgi:hypothetical protein